MKTIFEVLTKADNMTLPGGIAIRQRGTDADHVEFIVHNFNTDRATGTERHYWQGSYRLTLSEALTECARRVSIAERYQTGGALAYGEFEPTEESV